MPTRIAERELTRQEISGGLSHGLRRRELSTPLYFHHSASRRHLDQDDLPNGTEVLGQLMVGERSAEGEELHQQDYFLAVATGKGRRGLDKVLNETGLGNFFPITRCADESHSKPHPQMLLEIIDWYGVNASETIMVGDTEYDLLMATNANAHGVAVTYGVHDEQRLLDCNPVTCVNSVKDLRNWLLNV